MRLEFSGTQEIPRAREAVWELLLDHEFVASCAPGIEAVTAVDKTHFEVIAGFGVGKIRVRFTLHVELFDLDPPTSASMSVKGKAPGSAVNVVTSVNLESAGPDNTRLQWQAQSDVHGKVASVGARLLKGAAGKLTADFWEEFAGRVSRAT